MAPWQLSQPVNILDNRKTTKVLTKLPLIVSSTAGSNCHRQAITPVRGICLNPQILLWEAKKLRRYGKVLLMLAAVVLMGVVSSVPAEAKVKVKKVTVKSNYGKSVHVAVGKKIKLTTTVKVTPNKSANKKVTYKSSNKKIATVTSGGYVKGKKTGSCKITVTSKKNKKKKTTIKVKVVKKVTSVSLSKSSMTIPVGNSEKMKKTVLPATGSYKSVKWTTSNKKVATVSSAGVIKGISAGTATIKATSVEGSAKSASCKVKVLSADAISISEVSALSEDTVRVTLDRPKTLNASQIAIQGKRYSQGSYNTRYAIRKLRNYDNKTYDIVLQPNYSIQRDSFVKVTISALPGNGTKVMESQAAFVKNSAPVNQKWLAAVGEHCEKTIDLSEYCYGNISYKWTGSVPGITCTQKNNTLVFSGIYQSATPGTAIMVEALDEMGNVVKQQIQIAVGNRTNVVGMAPDLTILTRDQLVQKSFACALGGSGNYSFSATGMPGGLKVYEDGTITGTAISTGTSRVTITVTDCDNANYKAVFTATIKVADQKKVTGTVVDTYNKVVAGATVVCENLEDGTRYEAMTDNNGSYTVNVAEGSYHIYAVFAEKKDSVYNIAIATGGRRLDFELE